MTIHQSNLQLRFEIAVELAILANVPVSVKVCVGLLFKLVDTLFYSWYRGCDAGRPLVMVRSRTTGSCTVCCVALYRVEKAPQPIAASPLRYLASRTLLAP